MAPSEVAASAAPFVEDVSPVGDEWRHFYGQWYGKVDYHCPGELSYTRIWKDANNAIRYNLQKLEECCASREPNPDAMVCFFEGNPTDGCVPCGEGAPRPVANASRVRAVAFTFVREPIGHFVAGYAEVNWRAATNAGVANAYARSPDLYTFYQQPAGSRMRARAFVDDVLAGRVGGTWTDAHAYAQIGPLRHAPTRALDFVGKLENFTRDWAALGALGGVGDNFPYDPELGQHPGSAETADRDAMDALLRDDVSILRALCILLAPDYACFDYAMPPECADLQASLAHTCPLDDGWSVAGAVK